MTRASSRVVILAAAAVFALAGCEAGNNPFTKKDNSGEDGATAVAETSVRLVDRDVEAPNVFQVTDDALWDGRPSLGGVWVASPDTVDPERVILRNPSNGKFVIGALFRRERINPGPALQISSDAAAALGLLAGQPGKINVTALRREELPVEAPDATKPILDAQETVETTTLDPVATASAGLDKAAQTSPGAQVIGGAAPKPAPAAKPATPKPAAAKPATGGKRLIQIGIFSVEANANRAAATLTKAGVGANVLKETSQGKTFWRVVTTAGADLAKVKGLGFTDAYLVSR